MMEHLEVEVQLAAELVLEYRIEQMVVLAVIEKMVVLAEIVQMVVLAVIELMVRAVIAATAVASTDS